MSVDLKAKSAFKVISRAPVAQLDRASDYGSEGLEFESLRVHIFLSQSRFSTEAALR